jgi:uncharacterized protein with WD repeat
VVLQSNAGIRDTAGGISVRSLKIFIMLCLVSLIVTYEQISPGFKTKATFSSEQLRRDIREAYNVLSAYGAYYKEQLRESSKAGLESFDKQIQALGIKIRAKAREVRDEVARAANEWRGQKQVLEAKLNAVKSTCVAAWEATKKQISARIEDLKELYNPPSSANS